MSGGVTFVALEHPFTVETHGLGMGPTTLHLSACDEHDPDVIALRGLLERHAEATGSPRAARVLAGWPGSLERFVKLSAPPALAPERPDAANTGATLVPSK
jgi:glutamate synthase domain-containing protein 3